MKALVLEKKEKLVLRDIPGNDDHTKVTLKVKSMGICGSDISAYKGLSPLVEYPVVIGHEIAGEVISVPENNRGIKVGDRVILEPYKYCGKCYPCRIGKTNCCENLKVIGVHVDGGMSEYYSHDLHLTHKVPDNIPWELLPLIEPLTIALQGVKRVNVKKGENVVITGVGTIGLLVALLVLNEGAVPIAVDPLEKRLEIARSLGVKHILNPDKSDIVAEISRITDNNRAEVVIEASGNSEAVRRSMDYASYAGRISLVGYPKEEIPIPTFLITKKELDLKGSRNSVNAFPTAIKLLNERQTEFASVISDIIDFTEIPVYIKKIADNPNDYLKVIGIFK